MARQVFYRGRKIEVALETEVGPGGEEIRRDIILHPGAVAVLPLVDVDHVCLVRHRRPAVGCTLLEVPAGTLERDELPERAAPRELEEETGYRAGVWRKLAEFYPSPGLLSELTHLYLASDLTPGPARPEADEDLEPLVVEWRQAVAWALDGTLRDAKTLPAVLLWDRLRNT